MATVYALKNPKTGLYRNGGNWAEEPEWYDWASAKNIAESSFLPPMVIEPYECDHSDMDQL